MYAPSTFLPSQTVFVKGKHKYVKFSVLTIYDHESKIYTLKYNKNMQFTSMMKKEYQIMIQLNPDDHNPPLKSFPLWLSKNSNIKLFLNNMKQPQYGVLLVRDNKCYFCQVYVETNKLQILQCLPKPACDLIKSHQLF